MALYLSVMQASHSIVPADHKPQHHWPHNRPPIIHSFPMHIQPFLLLPNWNRLPNLSRH